MIIGSFYTHTAEMLRFCDNLYSVIIREGHMSQRPPSKQLLVMYGNGNKRE